MEDPSKSFKSEDNLGNLASWSTITQTTSQTITKRDRWKGKIDFLIACMGFSIGLGNVWRFPYLCYKNGGGAFLIPYFVSVILAGVPLFLLEVALGQFMSKGAIAAWDICPLFRGIGCASTMINFLVNSYYTVILGWAFHFIFASFSKELPWAKCGHSWNTKSCIDGVIRTNLSNSTSLLRQHILGTDPASEYWENRVLRISNGIDNLGTVQWDLALCLLLAWTIIFLAICRGIKTSGKVMYITATTPYIFMITLLIRTAQLEGALNGITYYLKPDWDKLTDMTVWSDAGTQIFFSYAIGLGALTALGSYNRYHHNSVRDCLLFAGANTFTSLLAGFVIFATLGNMSYISNVPIHLIAESGPGLAFIIYPKALGTMPGSPIWSFCFFIMIILLGIDSMFGGVEGFVAAISDYLPQVILNPWYRVSFVAATCILSYGIGLFMVTNVLFIFSVIVYEELTYMRAVKPEPYHFPKWSVILGWMMASSSLLFIPGIMMTEIIRTPGTFIECIQNIIGTNPYTNESAKEWARTIVDNCRSDLVKLGKPFKYVVNCTITQKPGSGVYSASSCYWDTGKDGNCKVKWENNHVYCIVVVFAISL
ncbi:putative sodium/chloride dependent neurotransmitter transporter [Schistosoma mansoni]|uniref:putative sodium/chloride dependent neurotransmitter transporter n=1 Tax=Schistosoma mansoni TaxID=6183 RepID=UPI0001A64666|nr:putative sodium/chloride dependent neurotransmitter transporter [Schistosoma mansoni]|eukprot:XP_018655491.1 putative sodium/chloride dependent neurotransmitter transporter [Schistosoma mansoni]